MSFNEALRYGYELDKDSIVFDLGGYKGEWSENIYKQAGCKPYLFEPAFQPEGNFFFHPFALGGHSRSVDIFVDGDKTGLICKAGAKKTISVIDIVSVLNEIDKGVDLMKINIEGMEYEVLPRLIESGWISRIKNLQVQFHRTMNSDEDMWKIQNELKQTHDLSWQFRYVWESWKLKAR